MLVLSSNLRMFCTHSLIPIEANAISSRVEKTLQLSKLSVTLRGTDRVKI